MKLLLDFLHRDHLRVEADFPTGIAALAVLHLATLVVIGVVAEELALGLKVGHKGVGGHVAVHVQIAEVVVAALLGTGPEGTAAERAVGKHPAVGSHIEHGPVVASDGIGGAGGARLPLGGDAQGAAEGDEGQTHGAAVAVAVHEDELGDILNEQVVADVGVADMLTDVVVHEPPFAS